MFVIQGEHMTRLILIRHGFSVYNKERRFSGHADVPLDEVGLLQAREVAEYVTKSFNVDAVYSSDLSRAYETVRGIAEAFSLSVIKRRELRELDVGVWQGRPVSEIAEEYPEEFTLFKTNVGRYRPVGGESYEEMMKRVMYEIHRIVAENKGKTVVIGTHGGVIRVIRAFIKGLSLDEIKTLSHVPNASVTILEETNGVLSIAVEGYNEYITQKTTEIKLK